MPHIAQISLLVRDYDEALAFYIDKLHFTLVDDTVLDAANGKRWVTIQPPHAPLNAAKILLAKAGGAEQEAAVGKQGGGRVFLFLATEDFDRDFERFGRAGVRFLEEPRAEVYGKVVVFEDLYGNRWDLIEGR